jgi:hypothetical protein
MEILTPVGYVISLIFLFLPQVTFLPFILIFVSYPLPLFVFLPFISIFPIFQNIPALIILTLSGITMLISLRKIFIKANQRAWASWVPMYNAYVTLKISEKPGWWLLLLFIPIINWVIIILTMVGLAENFGKKGGFAFGLSFVNMIFFPILAFGDAEYIGGYGDRVQILPPIVNTGKFVVGFMGGIFGGILVGALFGIGTIIAIIIGCGIFASTPTAELIVSFIIAGIMGMIMAAVATEDRKDEPRGGCFISILYAIGGVILIKVLQIQSSIGLGSISTGSPTAANCVALNWTVDNYMVSVGAFLLFSAILGGILGMIRGSFAGIDWGK